MASCKSPRPAQGRAVPRAFFTTLLLSGALFLEAPGDMVAGPSAGLMAQERNDAIDRNNASPGKTVAPGESAPGEAMESPAPAGERKPLSPSTSLPYQSSVARRNEAALRLFHAGARVEYLAALELKDQGSLRQALGRFENFRLLYPGHSGEPLVLRHIADIYDRLSMPAHALREIRRYVEDHPTAKPGADLLPLFRLKADLEYRLGRWPDALSTTRLVLRASPTDPQAARLRERVRELQKVLAPPASERENETREGKPGEQPPSNGPVSRPADRTAESSLDRLGEGLDDEK